MREGSGSAIFRIYLSTSTASRFYTGAVFLFDRLPETEIPGNEIATRMEAQENTIDHPVEGEIPATGLETRGPVIVRPNGAYIHPSHQPKGKLCEAKKEKIAGQDLSGIIMWNGDDDSMSLSRDEGKEDPLWVSKTTFAHRNTGKPEGAHRLRHTGKSPLEDHLYELVFVEENMESKLTVEWTQTETTGRIRVWKVPANQIGDSPVDITEVGENITQALESGARFSQQTIDRNVFLFESYEVTPKPGCGIGKKIELKVTPPGQAETKAFRFFLKSFGASLEGVQDPEKGWGTVDFYKEDGKQFVPHVNLARWASAYDGSEDVNDGIQLLDRDFFDGAAQRFRVEVRGPYYQYEEGNPDPECYHLQTAE